MCTEIPGLYDQILTSIVVQNHTRSISLFCCLWHCY